MKEPLFEAVSVEVAWRCCFAVFVGVLVFFTAVAVLDAIVLPPGDQVLFRSRSPLWIALGLLRVFRHFQTLLEGALRAVAAISVGLWLVAGAAIDRYRTSHRFAASFLIRLASLVAGCLAIYSVAWMILAVTGNERPLDISLAIVAAFSLAIYGSWRWVSLLLAVLRTAPTARVGWETFSRELAYLALAAATNSTLKWMAWVIAALPAVIALQTLQARHWLVVLSTGFLWILLSTLVSGFFAARFRAQITTLTWATISPHSQAA